MEKICKFCKKSFNAERERNVFCSRACLFKSFERKYKTTCQTCNKEFFTTPTVKAKFCSKKCHVIFQDIPTGDKSHFWKGGQIKSKCIQCNKEFFQFPSDEKKFCSHKCFSDSRKNKTLPWADKMKALLPKGIRKEGKYITKQGYIMIYQSSHPRIKSRNYIQEHILVAEKALGRFLEKGETIHHINGIKSDNRVENLYLFESVSAHKSYEMKLRYKKVGLLISNLTR